MNNFSMLDEDILRDEVSEDSKYEIIGTIVKNDTGKISLLFKADMLTGEAGNENHITEIFMEKIENDEETVGVSTEGAAMLARKSVQTIYRWYKEGKLANLNEGRPGKKLFSVQQILRLADANNKEYDQKLAEAFRSINGTGKCRI